LLKTRFTGRVTSSLNRDPLPKLFIIVLKVREREKGEGGGRGRRERKGRTWDVIIEQYPQPSKSLKTVLAGLKREERGEEGEKAVKREEQRAS
jgi:hypothetical protein